MRISTKGRYGLRAMIELARNHGSGPLTMNSIAEQQGISLKYLHALLATLRSSGLIRSVRGSKGGYALAKPPEMITTTDILNSLEGSMFPVECVTTPSMCENADFCAARTVWLGMHEAMTKYTSSITLAELAQKEKGNTYVRCI